MANLRGDKLIERWSRTLDLLGRGPEGFGPHDTEQVCATLERLVHERDEARQNHALAERYVQRILAQQEAEAMAERAAIVADLRESVRFIEARPGNVFDWAMAHALRLAADRYERGEHRKEVDDDR